MDFSNLNQRISTLLKSIEKGIVKEVVVKRVNELKEEKDLLENKLKQLKYKYNIELKENDFINLIEIVKDKLNNSNKKILNNF